MLLHSNADVLHMRKKYLQYIASIVLSVLAIAILFAIISLVYSVIKPESFFVAYSNIMFIVGGIVITLGAFIEFFVRAHSSAVGRYLLLPFGRLGDLPAFRELAGDNIEKKEDKTSGGWMLILIGALVIIISLIFALIGMNQAI